MSVVRVNSFPFITPDDKVLLSFFNYEGNARLFIKALVPGTLIELRSGATQAAAQAKVAADASSAVLIFDQVAVMNLPATSQVDRVTEIRCVQGRAAIDIVSPSEVHSFLSQLTPTIT